MYLPAATTSLRPTLAGSTDGYPDAGQLCEHTPYLATGPCTGLDWGPTPDNIKGRTWHESDSYSGRGYGYRNCTDYVAWKIQQVFGVTIPKNWGVALSWATSAGNTAGYSIDPAPQVGDIAVWTSGAFGHVAYVYGLSNGTPQLDEYNQQFDGNFRNDRVASANFYIHVGTIPPTPTPTPPPPPVWGGVGNAAYLGSDHIVGGQSMHGGQYVTSFNVEYALVMQTDGNLVAYHGAAAYWQSLTGGNPGAWLQAQTDGNVVIYAPGGVPIWQSHTGGQSLSNLYMQNDGNIVAYNAGGSPIWWTGTGGGPAHTYFGSDHVVGGLSIYAEQYIRSADGRHVAAHAG
jgi:surface antigen